MKTPNFFKIGGIAVLGLGMLFSGCKRETTADISDDEDIMQKNAMAEDYFNDAQEIADQGAISGDLTVFRSAGTGGIDDIQGGCATITRDTTTSPHSITIDFGTTNCLCRDGKNRRGIIRGTYTGRYRDAGTVITLTFDNYFVNDNQVEGTKTVTNEGLNASGHPQFHVVLQNGKITLANGAGVITWTADKYREISAGFNTPAWGDDEFNIWGTRTGTRVNGKSYTAVVDAVKPLHKTTACRFVVSGVATITPAGGSVRTLDFGDGSCDNKATLTVNGQSRQITLRH